MKTIGIKVLRRKRKRLKNKKVNDKENYLIKKVKKENLISNGVYCI